MGKAYAVVHCTIDELEQKLNDNAAEGLRIRQELHIAGVFQLEFDGQGNPIAPKDPTPQKFAYLMEQPRETENGQMLEMGRRMLTLFEERLPKPGPGLAKVLDLPTKKRKKLRDRAV